MTKTIQDQDTTFSMTSNRNRCQNCGKQYDKYENGIFQKRWSDRYCSSQCYQVEFKKHIKANMIDYLLKTGMPERLIKIAIESRPKSCYTHFLKNINKDQGLYLYGKTGTGKTIFACHAAMKLTAQLKKVMFISSLRLIMQLQDLYRTKKSVMEYLKKITDANVLIIDDLGTEKITDFTVQSLYFIVNEREQNGKQTIITSNYSLTDLNVHIDDRITSRIAGMCHVIEFKGVDMRMKINRKLEV